MNSLLAFLLDPSAATRVLSPPRRVDDVAAFQNDTTNGAVPRLFYKKKWSSTEKRLDNWLECSINEMKIIKMITTLGTYESLS